MGFPPAQKYDAPLDKKDGVVVCRTKNLLAWEYISDHRGETVYDIKTGESLIIKELGDYPAGTTTQAPATDSDRWDGAKWVTDIDAQQQSLLKVAASEKVTRVIEANSITQAWQTQLLLGIITYADRAVLTAWMKYVQDVQATDIAKAPDIKWPEKPS
ncbi:tail fiber assembly protein [Pantoea ananatis]|uniref:tail fiber assembly protein n=1 Tax=Pantoea ananas TaxID=553 RepID=UPI001B311C60|nr:tail fiber assembly protein [Pantoea ananatis]